MSNPIGPDGATTEQIKTIFAPFKIYTYNDNIPNFILRFTNLNPWVGYSPPVWNKELNCICFHTNGVEFQTDEDFNSKLGILE